MELVGPFKVERWSELGVVKNSFLTRAGQFALQPSRLSWQRNPNLLTVFTKNTCQRMTDELYVSLCFTRGVYCAVDSEL